MYFPSCVCSCKMNLDYRHCIIKESWLHFFIQGKFMSVLSCIFNLLFGNCLIYSHFNLEWYQCKVASFSFPKTHFSQQLQKKIQDIYDPWDWNTSIYVFLLVVLKCWSLKNWMHSFEVSLGYESVDRSTFSMIPNIRQNFHNIIDLNLVIFVLPMILQIFKGAWGLSCR